MAVHFTVSSGADIRNGIIADGHISGSANIAWSKVSKSGSNLTDLATRTLSGISDVTISAAELNAYDPTGRSSGTVPTSDGSNGITWSTPSISESDPLSLHLTGGTMAGTILSRDIYPDFDYLVTPRVVGTDSVRYANISAGYLRGNFLEVHGDSTWSGSTNTAGVYAGSGSPDGVLSVNPGSLYMDYGTSEGNAYVNVSSTFGTDWQRLARVLDASATLDFPSTLAGTSSDLTVTVTGAAVGDRVALGTPAAGPPANGIYMAWVSAADTVTVRFLNAAAIASDPASGTFTISVFPA